MIKKLSTLLLAMVVMLSSALPAFAKSNSEIKEEDKIKYLVDKKIVEGMGNGDLNLDGPIKRSELVKIIAYALGNEAKAKELNGKEKPFSDVEKEYWANGVIAVSKELKMKNGTNLINGYPDGTFKPESQISAAEVITVLVKVGKTNLTEEMVKNAKWPEDYVKWATEEKILNSNYGINDENLSKPLKRDIVFKMLYNAMDKEEVKEEVKVSLDDVKKAKETLKTYMDSIKLDVLKEDGVAVESNKKAIEEFNKEVERINELLKKEDSKITAEELKEIKKIPSYMDGDKKVKGSLRKFAGKVLLDFEVLGDRNATNEHTKKQYTEVKDAEATIKVKSAVKDLKQEGKKRLYLNYVTEKDFADVKLDATTGATPKYKKQEVPKENYTVTDNGDGTYTIKITKLPQDVKILKVIAKVEIANITNLENADLVMVNLKTADK